MTFHSTTTIYQSLGSDLARTDHNRERKINHFYERWKNIVISIICSIVYITLCCIPFYFLQKTLFLCNVQQSENVFIDSTSIRGVRKKRRIKQIISPQLSSISYISYISYSTYEISFDYVYTTIEGDTYGGKYTTHVDFLDDSETIPLSSELSSVYSDQQYFLHKDTSSLSNRLTHALVYYFPTESIDGPPKTKRCYPFFHFLPLFKDEENKKEVKVPYERRPCSKTKNRVLYVVQILIIVGLIILPFILGFIWKQKYKPTRRFNVLMFPVQIHLQIYKMFCIFNFILMLIPFYFISFTQKVFLPNISTLTGE